MKKGTLDKYVSDIRKGRVGVIPTDTLYGIAASAENPEAVERVYRIKGRSANKNPIILIPAADSLADFGVALTERDEKFLASVWPGKVSVVFPFRKKEYAYLDTARAGTLAFRVPDRADLREFLRAAGPVIAPSANPEGGKPARTAKEAREYFGGEVDFYCDGGVLEGEPSTLVSLKDGKVHILRLGAVAVSGTAGK